MARLIVLGAGGHARVLFDILLSQGVQAIEVTDINMKPGTIILPGISVIGNDDTLNDMDPQDALLINGVGMVPGNIKRKELYEALSSKRFRFRSVISAHAIVEKSADIGKDIQILHRAVVQGRVVVNDNCIINTGAIVEHDVTIGSHCHIAPGAVICGDCEIGEGVFIGPGATVVAGTRLGKDCIVAAGTTCYENLAEGARCVGAKSKIIVARK